MTNERAQQQTEREREAFEASLSLVRDEVDKVLSASPRIIRDYTSHLAKTVGKYIRGVSLLTCAISNDGFIHRDAVRFAAAIELIHLATLVHDDVIDNAELRRGELSLQKKYGKRTAVICGDYLLCAALMLAGQAADKEEYLKIDMPKHLARVVLGELDQHVNNANFDLSIRHYLKIISGKTAALFEASFYAGAILSETDEAVIRRYAKLGRYIGMIFQLTDDCMDFETTETVAKKPVQSDFEQNVITLPLIHAFRSLGGLKDKARAGALTRSEINEAVRRAGGLLYTRTLAKKYYEKAVRLLDELQLTEGKRERLAAILDNSYRVF